VNRPKGLAAMAAGIISAALVTGCAATAPGGSSAAMTAPTASGSGSAAPAPGPAPARVVTDALSTPLPVAAYQLTPLQLADEQYVDQRMTQLCMRSYGIDYLPNLSAQLITLNQEITEEFDSRWYGVDDAAAVSTSGYHLPTWTEGLATPSKLPPVGADVLTGTVKSYDHRTVPTGGCLTEVQNEMADAGFGRTVQATGGSGPGTVIGDIQSDAFQSAQSDPRVLGVFKKWSACMASAGYHYTTPFTAAADPRWTGSTAGAQEIRTAERDVSCKQQVGLVAVETAVISDHQQAALAQKASSLPGIKAQLASETASLNRLMSEYGPSGHGS
jgi:hypothetical protein